MPARPVVTDARWLTWTLIAVVFWGLWGAFAAEAEKHGTSALGVAAGVTLIEAMILVPAWPQMTRSGSWWMLATGIAGGIAYLALFMALKEGGPGPVVVAATSTYPVITVIVVAIVAGQAMTIRQMLGIVIAVAGVAILSTGG